MSALYRQNETQWSFSKGEGEVWLLMPGFPDRHADYLLAEKVKNFASQHPIRGKALLQWQGKVPASLGKYWKVKDVTSNHFGEFQKDSIFYKQNFKDVGVQVLKITPGSCLDKIAFQWNRWFPGKPLSRKLREIEVKSNFPSSYLHGVDPFTALATKAFQTDEDCFIAEREPKGSSCFALEGGKLSLRSLTEPISSEAKEAAVLAYRDFIKRAFEWNRVSALPSEIRRYGNIFSFESEGHFWGYLRETFGIDFKKMLQEGDPLLPDHVYKCNIAAQHIEINYLESLIGRLTYLRSLCHSHSSLPLKDIDVFCQFLRGLGAETFFSLKEIRNLYHAFSMEAKEKNEAGLARYLGTFKFLPTYDPNQSTYAVHHITAEGFHQLMQVAMYEMGIFKNEFSIEPFFTGRKILHLGITGYKTLGDKKVFDPSRNLAELLHIYPLLHRASFPRFLELLAHVVSKKALYSCFPAVGQAGGKEWKVGRLIPSIEKEGKTEWYYVDSYLNDGRGCVNYVFLPACKGFSLPLIKLYRSTASDAEAESSLDSLLADMNPKKVGSLDFSSGNTYDQIYFQRCTMPLWMGYLVTGDVDKALAYFPKMKGGGYLGNGVHRKEEHLLEFLKEERMHLGKNKSRDIMQEFKKRLGVEQWKSFLQHPISDEWNHKKKISEDIIFVGHSLGAALSQTALYHFSQQEKRLPLVGRSYHCYAFDPPGGITREENEAFLEFGREHKKLLEELHQKWKIHYQFEYRDFVPQGGPFWLGITSKFEDQSWLEVSAEILRPDPIAKDREIVTLPTHGRRFLHVTQGYQKNPLTLQELVQFKNAYWLPSHLRKKFGFAITIPRITEDLRSRIGGTFGFAILWLKKILHKDKTHLRPQDDSGVTFYSQSSA
ncbi:MAG: hypothetical protein FJZ64_00610 [Chlamydiae bacterium]|nr:hypothetical protein [Chlamydiota bacterium]